MSKNYNELITTNFPVKEDFYVGMYIQTIGNSKTVYEILNVLVYFNEFNIKTVNELIIKPSHRILDDNYIGTGRIVLSNLREITDYYDNQSISNFDRVCETIYTDQLNIIIKRNKKIKSLGI